MSEEYDPDKALEEYGYGKPGRGKTVAIVLLTLLVLASGATSVFLGKLWSSEQSKVLTFEQQVKDLSARISEAENKNCRALLTSGRQASRDRAPR